MLNQDSFTLNDFEGTLDFLLCLIQKEELDIYQVSIQDIIFQYLNPKQPLQTQKIERGAEFIGVIAFLIWLKSKKILPQNEAPESIESEMIEDPQLDILGHLIDYCKFKRAAKELNARRERQQSCYFRGIDHPQWKKPLGIDHVSLDDLADLFKKMISRIPKIPSPIQEEEWRVSDKIFFLREFFKHTSQLDFVDLFTSIPSRMEMIILFLALLELMKSGEIAVGREEHSSKLILFAAAEAL